MAIAAVLYEERTLGSRGGMVSVTWCWCGLRRLKEEMVGRLVSFFREALARRLPHFGRR